MDADDQLNANAPEKTRKRPYAAVVEQPTETAASTTTCPTSPRPENGSGKRRRRKLSCETCQRLKCRCDYDPVSRTCHRCKTLRRPCSITDDDFHIVPQPDTAVLDPSVEVKRRLEAVEGSITEIKMMIRDVQSSLSSSRNKDVTGTRHNNSRPSPQSPDLTPENAEPEDISDPADAGIGSAPAIVMRAMTTHLAGGRRRVLEHFNSDLVQLGVLDESSADTLIRLFYRHRDSCIVVRDVNLSQPSRELRKASPFLHAVCCLHGMPYGPEDWPPVNIRRQVYQQVRMMLGQALLASPLPLDEINAILLMSVYSNQSPVIMDDSPVDYIDSWLLTGYCAQQAMLSISFSTVVENVRRGKPTDEDRRAVRLWASVCLHHVHWAVTTGRPSTIPAPYMNQCNMLVSLFEATVHEGMVVAEILLYTSLNRKLTHHSYLDANGECDEFSAWKQKWCHLFALPRSSAFKLSYHSAYLILAVRSLEDFNNGRATEDLLSPEPLNQPSSSSSSLGQQHHRRGNNNNNNQSRHRHHQAQARAIALRFAVQILETFLEMSHPLRNEIPIYLHMCISYSALVIAQYWRDDTTTTTNPPPPAARASADKVLELLTALEDWCAAWQGTSLVTSYSAGLAKRRVLQSSSSSAAEHHHKQVVQGYAAAARLSGQEVVVPTTRGENNEVVEAGSPLYSAAEGLLGLGGGAPMAVEGGDASRLGGGGNGHNNNNHVLDDVAELGLDLTPDFPSMEDFFGGGFLDFMR